MSGRSLSSFNSTDVDPAPIAEAVADVLGPDIPSADTIEARAEQAIVDKVADSTIPSKSDVLSTVPADPIHDKKILTGGTIDGGTGLVHYVLQSAVFGDAVLALLSLIISSDEAITWELWNGSSYAFTNVHPLPAGTPFPMNAPNARGYRTTDQSYDLVLRVSSDTATIRASYSFSIAT